MNKYLFLDVDGVLNSFAKDQDFLQPQMNELKRINDSVPGLKVVISSSWRHSEFDYDLLKIQLEKIGIKPYSQTPCLSFSHRSLEVKRWLRDNASDPFKYAVLDDIDEAFDEIPKESCFKTNPMIGLTKEIADKIILHLN